MKLNDLKYHQALVKYKNFSQVAVKFNVSQPTITMAIQRLEKDFGTSFFVRDYVHRQLHITSTDKQFTIYVDVILNELKIAHQEINQTESSGIRFGLPPTTGNYYFPPLTPLLIREGLLSHSKTFKHGPKEVFKMLKHGHLDLVLLGSLSPLKEAELKTTELAGYPFKIIVNKRHPLTAKKEIDLATLKNERFIVPDTEFFHEQTFKQISHLAHFRPQVIYRTADIHVIKTMVAENLGIAYLTSLAIIPEDNIRSINVTNPLKQSFHLSAITRSTGLLTAPK